MHQHLGLKHYSFFIRWIKYNVTQSCLFFSNGPFFLFFSLSHHHYFALRCRLLPTWSLLFLKGLSRRQVTASVTFNQTCPNKYVIPNRKKIAWTLGPARVAYDPRLDGCRVETSPIVRPLESRPSVWFATAPYRMNHGLAPFSIGLDLPCSLLNTRRRPQIDASHAPRSIPPLQPVSVHLLSISEQIRPN